MHTSFKTAFVAVLGLSSVVSALPGGVPTYGGGSSSTQGGGVNTCSPTTVTITKKGGGHVGELACISMDSYQSCINLSCRNHYENGNTDDH